MQSFGGDIKCCPCLNICLYSSLVWVVNVHSTATLGQGHFYFSPKALTPISLYGNKVNKYITMGDPLPNLLGMKYLFSGLKVV